MSLRFLGPWSLPLSLMVAGCVAPRGRGTTTPGTVAAWRGAETVRVVLTQEGWGRDVPVPADVWARQVLGVCGLRCVGTDDRADVEVALKVHRPAPRRFRSADGRIEGITQPETTVTVAFTPDVAPPRGFTLTGETQAPFIFLQPEFLRATFIAVHGLRGGLEPLIGGLRHTDPHVRASAAAALGRIGDAKAVNPLMNTIADPDVMVRARVADALGRLGDTRATTSLAALLWDPEARVRAYAAASLGRMADPRGVEPLIEALKDSDTAVRAATAEALGSLYDTRAVQPLIAALGDKDQHVRAVAARSLGNLRDPAAVEPLLAAMKDKDEYVRAAAAEALRRITGRNALPDADQ